MLKNYRIQLLATAFTGVLGFATPSLAAVCTGGSALTGSYSIAINGQNNQGVAKFVTGEVYFNGACGFTGDLNVAQNAQSRFYQTVFGTYNSNGDGTITLNMTLPGSTTPDSYAVAYSPTFHEAVGVENDNISVATIDLQAQSSALLKPIYNVASLKGTFAASCIGQSGTYSDLNYFTFDGNGHITAGIDYYNNYSNPGVNTYVGNYVIDQNGVFLGGVTLGGNLPFGYTGVLTNNGAQVIFTYNVYPDPNGKYPGVAVCTGKFVQ